MAIRVMIVDDSNFMRKSIAKLLSSDHRIEIVSLVASGEEALQELEKVKPDAITLDWELPGMNGLMTLCKIMSVRPTPVVMFSAYTKKGADVTLQALKAGAIDFVQKPSGSISLDLAQVREELVAKVITAASSRVRLAKKPVRAVPGERAAKVRKLSNPEKSILFIASSTGGVQALSRVVPHLPGDLPMPTIIVQHMPPLFTKSLATSLNENSAIMVKEAEDGELVRGGTVYIAPGGWQTKVVKSGKTTKFKLDKSSSGNRLKPCADVTMESIASSFRNNIVGVVLTGMGDDGTAGAKAFKNSGGIIVAQDEATSTIYGMPRSVIEAGLADTVLPLDEIADHIASLV